MDSCIHWKQGPAAMSPEKHEILNACSRCVMTLGMLSCSMATIQDHRSWLQKQRTATSTETSEHVKNMCNRCVWTLIVLSWSIVKIHGCSMHITNTHFRWLASHIHAVQPWEQLTINQLSSPTAGLHQTTRDGTRAHNLLLRGEAPYPLGHTSQCLCSDIIVAILTCRACSSLPFHITWLRMVLSSKKHSAL